MPAIGRSSWRSGCSVEMRVKFAEDFGRSRQIFVAFQANRNANLRFSLNRARSSIFAVDRPNNS